MNEVTVIPWIERTDRWSAGEDLGNGTHNSWRRVLHSVNLSFESGLPELTHRGATRANQTGVTSGSLLFGLGAERIALDIKRCGCDPLAEDLNSHAIDRPLHDGRSIVTEFDDDIASLLDCSE